MVLYLSVALCHGGWLAGVALCHGMVADWLVWPYATAWWLTGWCGPIPRHGG